MEGMVYCKVLRESLSVPLSLLSYIYKYDIKNAGTIIVICCLFLIFFVFVFSSSGLQAIYLFEAYWLGTSIFCMIRTTMGHFSAHHVCLVEMQLIHVELCLCVTTYICVDVNMVH